MHYIQKIQKWLFFALVTLSSSISAESFSKEASGTDYLKLTQKNLPHMQVMIQAALDNMDMAQLDLRDLKSRIKQSALLPKLRIGMYYSQNDVAEYGYVDGYTLERSDTSADPEGVVELQQEYTRYGATGNYSDSMAYYATVTWNLSELVFDSTEPQYSSHTARRSSNRRRRIVDVSRRYMLLASDLPENSDSSVAPGKIVEVLQNAIFLDRMCGNLLSRTLAHQ